MRSGNTRTSKRSRNDLVSPDRTRAYLITRLFYYALEIEMFFPFNPFTWIENKYQPPLTLLFHESQAN